MKLAQKRDQDRFEVRSAPSGQPPPDRALIIALLRSLLEEQRATNANLVAIRQMLDEYFGVSLNAKYPYGQPTDRWGRR